MVAQSLVELLHLVDRVGHGAIEYRGRVFHADRGGIKARFVMADGFEGVVAASWPADPIASEDGRSQLLHALNSLAQRCGMFEVCERAYSQTYGRRTA